MPVRLTIPYYEGVYFITITCSNWANLFEEADAYVCVYKWFDYLCGRGHYIIGYVIMPNHLHAVLAFRNTNGESINKIIGDGKRFMAYYIVNRLTELGNDNLLNQLAAVVNTRERRRKKLHNVFEPSFDWKECMTERFTIQKLDYIHMNPCKGKWMLVEEYWQYLHSSALFYVTGDQGIYPITHVTELRNLDLTIPKPE